MLYYLDADSANRVNNLYFAHILHLRVPYDFYNKQALFHQAELFMLEIYFVLRDVGT